MKSAGQIQMNLNEAFNKEVGEKPMVNQSTDLKLALKFKPQKNWRF